MISKASLLFIIAGLILLSMFSQAQTPIYSLQYSYDANGNRTARALNFIIIRSAETNDSVQEVVADSAALLVNERTDNNTAAGEHTTASNTDKLGEQQIILYPNPTKGSLTLQIAPFPQHVKVEVRLFDQQAHYLFTTPCVSENTPIDLSPC